MRGIQVMAALFWLSVFPVLASAQTQVNFGSVSAGYPTDNPDVVISFINPSYNGNLIIQANGVTYTGPVTYTAVQVISSSYPLSVALQSNNVMAHAADGSVIFVRVNVIRTTTKVNSGRAHYYITRYFVSSGVITIP